MSEDTGHTTTDTLVKRMESNPKYVAAHKAVEARNAPIYEKMSKDSGKSVNVIKMEAVAKAQKIVDESEVYTRVSHDTLGKILESGRFKNLHETGVGTALSNKKLRTEVEEKGMGVPPDAPNAVKPLSVYLGGRDFSTVGKEKGADSYGDVVVKLKDHVKDRSTVTLGDSLSEINNGYSVGSPMNRMTEGSINPREIQHNPQFLDSHAGYHSSKGFIEGNVHGGLSLEDVHEIGFPAEPDAATKKKLDAAGVKYRVYQRAK